MGAKEGAVQKKILDDLKKRGCLAWKFQATSANAFVPDIVGLTPSGTFIGVEVKTISGKATFGQLGMIKNINNRKGIAFVCYGYDDYLNKMEDINL